MKSSKSNKATKYHYGSPSGSMSWELAICVLVVVSLVMLAIDFFAHPSPEQLKVIRSIDLAIASVLLAEFFVRLVLSQHKTNYLKYNWWYLFAAIPLATPLAEALRSLRLIGFMRIIKISGHVVFERNQK